jgi:hypothetical protein
MTPTPQTLVNFVLVRVFLGNYQDVQVAWQYSWLRRPQ